MDQYNSNNGTDVSASIFAPAKINVFLHIMSKDQVTGYHMLQSLISFVDMGDTLEISRSKSSYITLEGPFSTDVPVDENNTVMKALLAFKAIDASVPDVHIHITKRIPTKGGYGGSSVDAAAFIKCYANMCGISELDEPTCLRIGSDIPACMLSHNSVLIEGQGSIRERYKPHVSLPVLLAYPYSEEHSSTGSVFGQVKPGNLRPPLEDISQITSIQWLKDNTSNSMPIISKRTRDVLSMLEKTKAVISRMSGSGAGCFAIFENDDDMQLAKDMFKQSDIWTYSGRVKV